MNEKQMNCVRVALVALATLATLFTATSRASAAGSGEPGVAINVPFDFYCGDALFLAGEYAIEQGPAPNIISIRQAGRHNPSWVPAIPERSPSGRDGKASLVFTRYPDGRNYLREIRNPSAASHYFSRGRIEKKSVIRQDNSAGASPLIVAGDSR